MPGDLRLLLVITGKGRGGDREDYGPIPIRRGVLKQQVPGWLTAPPLGPLVLEIREAHQRHGGGGAYYVYLRRPRDRRRSQDVTAEIRAPRQLAQVLFDEGGIDGHAFTRAIRRGEAQVLEHASRTV
jgi:hypothetical protein